MPEPQHPFSRDELKEIFREVLREETTVIREAFREELADAGLRLDGDQHMYDAREDFRFLRRLRQSMDSLSSKVGTAVILAIVSGAMWLLWMGTKIALGK